MNIQYAPEIRQSANQMKLLEQGASTLLAEIVGPHSSQVVNAEWTRVQDQGRPLYRLTLRDFSGQVSTDFATDELENPLHMKVRLYRLWGDLLQVRNNQQHQQVQIISSQLVPG